MKWGQKLTGKVERYLRADRKAEAFLVTKEVALECLEGAALPFGLSYASASWHPGRREVSRFSIRVREGDWDRGQELAQIGSWVVRDSRGQLSAKTQEEMDRGYVSGRESGEREKEWMEYALFLTKELNKTAVFLEIHGIRTPKEVVEEGRRRRAALGLPDDTATWDCTNLKRVEDWLDVICKEMEDGD